MNRIDQIFEAKRAADQGAVMPFLTAGYPSLAHTEALLPAMESAGAAICEIGFPFSDPIADGPVIQASMTHALNSGIRLEQILETVAKLRPKLSMGLVAMVSYSIVYRIGIDPFVAQAKAAGFDGFIIPDLPLEEADTIQKPVKEAGLIASFLIAPTTPIERAKAIAARCSGFIYLLARSGITGERDALPEDLIDRIQAIQTVTDLPIAVGFGVGKPEHVQAITSAADAAIVGSALVNRITACGDVDPETIAKTAEKFVGELVGGQR